MARGRSTKRVVWKEPEAARVPNLRPHPLYPSVELPSAVVDEYMVALVPGGLFVTKVVLMSDERYSRGYERHEFLYVYHDPYAWQYGTSSVVYPAGTLAIYAGQHRVEETGRAGDKMRVPRHTFVIGGVRYLTADLHDFKPA